MADSPIWRRYQRFLGSDPGADVEDELRFHLEMRVEELRSSGLSEAEAERRARREFGDIAGVRSELREIGRNRERRSRRVAWVDAFGQDVRFAGRTFRKSPGFALLAIVTLGLGIGGATALFSVVEGVLLRPLPFPEADRIVQVWQLGEQGSPMNFSDPNFRDVAERSRAFESLAAYTTGVTPVFVDGAVSRVAVTSVSEAFFAVFGVAPAIGRGISAEEMATGAPVAVVSDEFWRQELSGTTELAGRTVRIGDRIYTVVGVLPAGRAFPSGSGVWMPRDPGALAYRTGHNWLVVGRLSAGSTVDSAHSELTAIAADLKREYGDETWMVGAQVVPLQEQLTGRVRPALLVLLGAAGFLLVVACANVVNLLLARASSRRGEIAVRQAMGAGRGRLTRQFLTESLVLSLAGGGLGVAVAIAGVPVLLALEPGRLPRVDQVSVNGTVLLFALAVSAGAAALLGLLTSFRSSDRAIQETLSDGGRSNSGGAGILRLRSLLMAVQIAVTLVLLVGAGLLVRSFVRLASIDPGFRTEGAIVVDAFVSRDDGAGDLPLAARVRDQLTERLSSIPGLETVGVTDVFPFSGGGSNGTFLIISRPDEVETLEDFSRIFNAPARSGDAHYRVASADYFEAMGIPLLRGRLFDSRDTPEAQHVAVVSESLAEARWPGEDPIGKLIQYGNMDGDLRPFTIVGVVGDVRGRSLDSEPLPTFYGNAMQRNASLGGVLTFVVVPRVASPALVPTVYDQLRAAAPDVPIRVRPIEEVLSTSLSQRRFSMLLLGVFAATALLLAVTGIYGVVSYLVAQRRREWGIRIALGATGGDVLRQVVRNGMTLVAIGIGAGLLVALGSTRLLEGLLYGVGSKDLTTFAAVPILLAAVALVASWVPASRAARVDPTVAIRD